MATSTASKTAETKADAADAATGGKTPKRQSNLAAATNAANKTLREKYREEWNGYMEAEMTARGEKWAPRQSAEEKAKAKYDALIAEFPHLANGGASA